METISMSHAERKRLEVFSRVKSGNLMLQQVCEMLGSPYYILSRYPSGLRFGAAVRGHGASSRVTGCWT